MCPGIAPSVLRLQPVWGLPVLQADGLFPLVGVLVCVKQLRKCVEYICVLQGGTKSLYHLAVLFVQIVTSSSYQLLSNIITSSHSSGH